MSDFVLEPGSMRGQLILGNAATGKSPGPARCSVWPSSIVRWSEGGGCPSKPVDAGDRARPRWRAGAGSLVQLPEGTGQETRDHSPAHHHLFIPTRYVVLEKTVLGGSTAIAGWSATRDIVLNVLGFVPFGFLMFRYYQGTSPARWMQASSSRLSQRNTEPHHRSRAGVVANAQLITPGSLLQHDRDRHRSPSG